VTITAQERAERSAAAMWETDQASKWLGMRLDSVGPGRAEMSFEVHEHHCNGHLICHGGYIFTLADSAFAYACNSHNRVTLAQQNAITFCAPGHKGDRLTATAIEVMRLGRSGVYDVTVTNQHGRIVAVMRGNSRTIKGTNFEEENTDG
jgi:acyl-CoA thioesterase